MARLEFTPELVQEAVILAVRRAAAQGAPLAEGWNLERERIRASPAGAERERAFRDFDASWFRELELDEPLRAALRACPTAERGLAVIYVRAAARVRDAGSELYAAPALHGSDGEGARMVLALAPAAFLEPEALERFVLRELSRAQAGCAHAVSPRRDRTALVAL